MKAYQKDHGLAVDGIAGKNTLAAINAAIEELTANGTLTEISMRYFGADISPAVLAQ